ncbi:MAG: methionine--tRNA ligase subunit beta [archaeon]|jgi:tRNA-binding protein
MELIEYDDFAKLELGVVKVIEAEKLEGSRNLIKLTVSEGEKQRVIVSGISGSYTPEELVGKKIVMLLNLKPKKIFNIESNGMILAAENGENISLLVCDKELPEGSKIR